MANVLFQTVTDVKDGPLHVFLSLRSLLLSTRRGKNKEEGWDEGGREGQGRGEGGEKERAGGRRGQGEGVTAQNMAIPQTTVPWCAEYFELKEIGRAEEAKRSL